MSTVPEGKIGVQGSMGCVMQRLTATITKRPKEPFREALKDVTEGGDSHFFSSHT